MNRTVKLYENDGMLTQCRARVLSCKPKDGNNYITLDQSIFAPEGGGQKADKGYLYVCKGECEDPSAKPSFENDHAIELLDGQEKIKGLSGSGPLYLVSEPLLPGTEVLCKLNGDLRLMRMQQHSGEHILSGIVHSHFGYDNISFHLSDTEPVIVCFNGTLTKEDIESMELLANKAIRDDLPIQVSYPSEEELASITYRSKIEINGQVRLVTIPGIDVCACCAPHLPTTGRVGLLKVLSSQSYKGGTQLNILCGERALRFLMEEHDTLTDLARHYSTSAGGLKKAVLSQQEELLKAQETLARIREEELLGQIGALKDTDTPCLFAPGLSPHAMKICYNALCSRFDRYCGVFNGDDESGYQFYAGHPDLDSNELAARMRQALDAKGGGSQEMIQGKVQKKKEELLLFFQNL